MNDGGGWRWFATIGGFVTGFLLDWLAIVVGVVATYVVFGDTGDGPGPFLLIIAGFLAVPVIVAFLLAKRELRVPFLIGVAAGAIVGSGVCAGTWAVNL